MRQKLISLISFTILFICGIILVVVAAINKNLILMYIGLGIIILVCTIISGLILYFLKKYLDKK